MGTVSPVDGIGFAASLLTLLAFAQTRMVPMRLAAVGANLLFLTYGALGSILPVIVLHAILLPLNLARLAELLRGGRPAPRFGSVRREEAPATGAASGR